MISETGKLSFNGENEIAVKFVGILWLISKAKMNMLSSCTRLRLPFLVRFRPRHTFVAGSISLILYTICLIIFSLTTTQIFSSIIQSVSILMICFWIIVSQNTSVHVNQSSSFHPDSIVNLSFTKAMSEPVPLHQPLVIGSIDNRIFTASERNVANGWIVRLFNQRTNFVVLAHVFNCI